MRGTRIGVLLTAAFTAAALAGCGSGDSGQGAGDSAQPRVGYISFGESTPYVHLITQGIQRAAKENGVDLIVCDSAQDAEKALQCASRFKQQHVDGLINYQGDATAAERICAQGPDVPVIAITVHQQPCEVSWTGADNSAAGQMAGKALGDYFKQKFDCKYDAYVSIEVTATGQTGKDRMGGYRSGFESVCGPVHDFHSFDSKADAQVARSSMADLLTALPNAHRIVVASMADAMAVGALSAVASADRLDDVFLSSQGLDSGGVCGMRKYSGAWVGDTAYFPEKYGDTLIPAILKAIDGEALPEVLPAKTEFVTPQTVDDIYPDVKC